MKNKEILIQALEEKRKNLDSLEKELIEEETPLGNDPKYVDLEVEIWKLEDKLSQDKREPIPPKGSGLGIAASIIAIIAGFFVTKIISVVGAVILVVLLIIRSNSMKKQKNENDTLLAPTKAQLQKLQAQKQQMRDQYPRIRVLENEIATLTDSIAKLESELDAINAEENAIKSALGTNDISQYEKNYVFIHVGYYYNSSVPQTLRHQILIDGQDFGYAQLPFSKFEMNPGVHTLKIDYRIGDSFYTTNVVQFRVEEGSKMFTFKALGAGRTLTTEYNNFATFLAAIPKK